MATGQGTRGKYAEGKVRAELKKRSDEDAQLDFYRYPDARAGSFATTPADFEVLHRGRNFLIEVKEVDHAFRLPHKNFSPDQAARMKKRSMAGGFCFVLIYHTPLKLWRRLEIHELEDRTDGASWVLEQYPLQKLKDILDYMF